MSPTALYRSLYRTADVHDADRVAGRGVPGVWEMRGGWVGTGEGYTGTQALPVPDRLYTVIQPQGPTYGQMKAISGIS